MKFSSKKKRKKGVVIFYEKQFGCYGKEGLKFN